MSESKDNTPHTLIDSLPSEGPLISVIVRTQNRPHLLTKALQSIVDQTYATVEAVVVNDGGSDVAAIVKKFELLINAGARLIQHTEVQGRSAAANSGLQAAKGIWVSFLDDDDTLEPEGLARLVQIIEWDKDIIYGQVQALQMATGSGKVVKTGVFGDPNDMDSLLLNNTIPICAYICKREQAIAVGGFDEKFEFLEDWEFFYRLSRNARIHYVPELVANYCIWGESHITGKNREQEVRYRRLFFTKHLASFSADVLQRVSLNFFEIMNHKKDKFASALAGKTREFDAILKQNNSLVAANQQQHDRVIQLETDLKHVQSAYEHQIKKVEAASEQSTLLAKASQQQHDETLRLDVDMQHLQAAHKHQTQDMETLAKQHNKTLQLEANQHNKVLQLEAKTLQLEAEQKATKAQLVTTQREKQWYAEYVGPLNQYQQRVQDLEKQIDYLKHENQRWVNRMREVTQRTLQHVALRPQEELIDLAEHGLTVLLKVLCTAITEVQDVVTPFADVEFPIPVAQGKTLQWSFTWQVPMPANALLLKLGTYCRINRCHLALSITPEGEENAEPILSKLAGQFAKDNHYASFPLDKPLEAGTYICKLNSPDTDGIDNVLGVWLTTNHKRKAGHHIKNYHYAPPNCAALTEALKDFTYLPVISILLPTYNTPERFLRACLDSVVEQVYPHWELCIADDASTESQVREILDSYQRRFPSQIKVIYRATNQHISATSNAALTLANGQFIALLDHDDLLTKDALFEVIKLLNEAPQTDFIYSDEDKWDDSLQCFDEPFFKPDWSPETLKGQMYTCHLSVYRKSLVDELGGFREGVEGSQDWDLALRCTEKTQAVRHISKILYHWRKHTDSTATNTTQKNYAIEAGLQVVQDALDREEEGGQAILNNLNYRVLVHYPVIDKPLVSIVIPTKDQASLLKPCLDSIIRDTGYSNWEVIIVDNGSSKRETFRLFKHYHKLLGAERFKVRHEPGVFNFSYLVNQGVKAAQGEIILLLNDDTEVISPTNWLAEMVGYARRDAIAGVGCKLLYDDDTIQHAGIICGIGGVAHHSHVNYSIQDPGYFDRLTFVTNYSGATGACLMIKRSLWEKVGGFDEKLAVAFNDVDFCLRLLKEGYRHVVLPHVLFYHHESKSRGQEDTSFKQHRFMQEVKFIQARWPKIQEPDPYYSMHLNQKTTGDFSISQDSIYYCDEDAEVLP